MLRIGLIFIFSIFGLISCKEKSSIAVQNEEGISTDSLAYINYNRGIDLAAKYDFENALPYLLKSVDQFEIAQDFNMQTKALLRLSLAYHDFGNYGKGIEYAYLAKKVLDEHPKQTNRNHYWYVYNDAGISYDDSKRPYQAIEEHLKALSFAANASDSSYSYNNLGNTYKKINQLDNAEKYFILSLKSSKDYNDDYHFATLHSNLVDIERLKKNYMLAERHLDSAFHYANKSNSPEKLLDIYYYSYQLKNETGDYHAAANDLNNYVGLKDSLFTSEKNDAVLHYQTRYETEKKEKILAETQLQSRQKSIWMILLCSAILIGLGIFRNYSIKSKLKQKQLALENELLHQQANTKIQEQRLQISRDLHDSLGAQLTFIHTILDGLKNVPSKSEATVISKINMLADLSQNSITELKSTLWVLNTKEIHIQQLKEKFLNFIKSASEAKDDINFKFQFDVLENFDINSEQAVNLFRTLQEIVNNALKHADATEIKIKIDQDGRNLYLNIVDNGKGFDYENNKSKSFGLSNIERRIASISGKMNVETSVGKGTKYVIQIKL